jgi:hydroxymethylpyrimidine kinase/phosphomethylpyrimidine kinase
VIVASIGTSDPWNAAGLGLDVLALAECGVRPVTVVAGVTAQDRNGIAARHAVPPSVVAAQLHALRDAEIAAYRIGALLDVASLDVVGAHIAAARAPAVYDPVLSASGGGDFADPAFERAMLERFVPHVRLLTPNLDEAARLTGMPAIESVDAMEAAGRALCVAGAHAVLVKGGHLVGAAVVATSRDVARDGLSARVCGRRSPRAWRPARRGRRIRSRLRARKIRDRASRGRDEPRILRAASKGPGPGRSHSYGRDQRRRITRKRTARTGRATRHVGHAAHGAPAPR